MPKSSTYKFKLFSFGACDEPAIVKKDSQRTIERSILVAHARQAILSGDITSPQRACAHRSDILDENSKNL